MLVVVGAKGWGKRADDVSIVAHKIAVGSVVVYLEYGRKFVGKQYVNNWNGGAYLHCSHA